MKSLLVAGLLILSMVGTSSASMAAEKKADHQYGEIPTTAKDADKDAKHYAHLIGLKGAISGRCDFLGKTEADRKDEEENYDANDYVLCVSTLTIQRAKEYAKEIHLKADAIKLCNEESINLELKNVPDWNNFSHCKARLDQQRSTEFRAETTVDMEFGDQNPASY